MDSTEGFVRGQDAVDLGSPISVPVGRKTLGRILNVIGEPIDDRGPVETEYRWFIHSPSPLLSEMNVATEILETGIKVT